MQQISKDANAIHQPAIPSQDSSFSVRPQQSIVSPELPPHSSPVFSVVQMEDILSEDIKPKELTSSSTQEKVAVSLLDSELWNEFSQAQNEMIITKVGRNLFPVIKIKVERLNPDEIYKVELDICSVDDCRYKYHENEWVVAGKAEPLVPSSSYVHPDTPSKGSEIMKQPLSFRKVKITNSNDQKEGYITLNSMHKYVPRVTISIKHMGTFQVVESVNFNETMFYAVTAYQNQKVTQLKIKYNPFAKGFRGSELSSYPRSSVFYSRFGQFNRQAISFNPIDPNRSTYLANPSLSPPTLQSSPYISSSPKPYMQLQPDTPDSQYFYSTDVQQPCIPVTIRGPYYGSLNQPQPISYTTQWPASGLVATPQPQTFTNPSTESSSRGFESPQNLPSSVTGVLAPSLMPVLAQQPNQQTQSLQLIQQTPQCFPLTIQQPVESTNQNTQPQSYTSSTCTASTSHGQAY
ncbi:T-Box (Tbx) transcription factor [Oopsacas minuta]|uniref:T-Box (Tbx) transcription factor n=1 Tax=Oopsacas minuta TaxID=111878 RepID=A0AAV7JIS3_9METZ|nr:T-Box (Tbx) transcription factor [Oopsacas minuta]